VAPQPRADSRAIVLPRMQSAPRVESPRATTPQPRQEGERRGPRDGGR
jgi:hypothetical protein